MKQKNSYIYIIFNKLNNKFYLGSTDNPKKRKSVHFKSLKDGKHHSIALQRAYDKYGSENFEFKTICICSKEEKLKVEQDYLSYLIPEYNTSKSSTAPMEGRKHNSVTKEKFKNRKVASGKDHFMYGKKWSEEQRKACLDGRKQSGYTHSDETKLKMRQTALNQNRALDLEKSRYKIFKKVIDSQGNIFEKANDAAKFWNISPATLTDILKGRHKKTRKGISFKYYEK